MRRRAQSELSRASSLREHRRSGPILALGEWAEFVWRAVRGVRKLGPYAHEVLRQAALIAAASTLVIIFVTFLIGASCGLEASVIGRQVGAGSVAPIFAAVCTVREIVPVLFGMILAGKVGCGMVAELGAMRVNEEVDALEVMGISSMVYLVSCRLVAALLVIPPIYLCAVASSQAGAWLASYVRFRDVSQGTWELAFYTALDPIDLVFSVIKGLTMFLTVLVTALYFGYRVRGGPVEVGVAVARSMAVNLVLIAIVNMIMSLVLWGWSPPIPIA